MTVFIRACAHRSSKTALRKVGFLGTIQISQEEKDGFRFVACGSMTASKDLLAMFSHL